MTPTEGEARLTLRQALLADCGRLASLHVAARAQAPMPASVHDVARVQSWLEGRLGADETWVAERGVRVVGYARFGQDWLDDLYVDPHAWRDGVGTALLDLVKARRPAGFSLWVFESNAPARRFYARHGLVELERTDGDANEERSPDVRVVWPGAEPRAYLSRLLDDVEKDLDELTQRRAALLAALDSAPGGAALA
ncbi:MAG: GNAT family N-acetyltransferase [Nocardioides sp.]|uniref:GNAT family N-acetyltransferase n=1 Tax=Nocardioides sp. TaxID=35761 RepID=UPI003F0F5856